MNRRSFLINAMIAAAAIPVSDGLLWQPTKKIFIPPTRGWTTVQTDLAGINAYVNELVYLSQESFFNNYDRRALKGMRAHYGYMGGSA